MFGGETFEKISVLSKSLDFWYMELRPNLKSVRKKRKDLPNPLLLSAKFYLHRERNADTIKMRGERELFNLKFSNDPKNIFLNILKSFPIQINQNFFYNALYIT